MGVSVPIDPMASAPSTAMGVSSMDSSSWV